ncbi:hypothetical protein SNE40_013714 [Patella caerulea]
MCCCVNSKGRQGRVISGNTTTASYINQPHTTTGAYSNPTESNQPPPPYTYANPTYPTQQAAYPAPLNPAYPPLSGLANPSTSNPAYPPQPTPKTPFSPQTLQNQPDGPQPGSGPYNRPLPNSPFSHTSQQQPNAPEKKAL